jgi:hypothetical protein
MPGVRPTRGGAMIPSLLQLWLATAYVLAVAVVVRRRGAPYVGRHRAVEIDRAALARVLKEPTQELPVPAPAAPAIPHEHDSEHNNGADRYARLNPDELDTWAVEDLARRLAAQVVDELAEIT